MKNRAAFLDRDGVLNVDHDYVFRLEDWEWIPGAKEALSDLKNAGYLIFVVTNQSGIAREMFTMEDFLAITDWMESDSGGLISKTYACPHLPEISGDCDCRKPKPGLLFQAIAEFDVDPAQSFLIGDKPRDVQAAEGAGVTGYQFEGGNLQEFVQKVLELEEKRLSRA